jgi:hypothetical protein
MFNGFKMSSFRCITHVQEIILPKNMFGCQLKLINWDFLGFFTLLAVNQNVDSQLCMDVKTHHLHMNYLKLDYLIFFIKFVSNKMLFAKSNPTNVLKSSFFLGTLTMNKPTYDFFCKTFTTISPTSFNGNN